MDDEHYIDGDHNGGVFNSFNHNSYGYCYQNPVKYLDPNGKQSLPETVSYPELRIVHRGNVLANPKVSPGKSFIKQTILGIVLINLQELFTSSEDPAYQYGLAIATYGRADLIESYDQNDDKGIAIQTLKQLKNKSDKTKEKNKYGSYTITYQNGKKYHGKGKISRMFLSAIEHTYKNDDGTINYPILLDWDSSKNERQSYKDEHTRMQTDVDLNNNITQGYNNPINYNQRNSPGYKYKVQDGEITPDKKESKYPGGCNCGG
jgi:hypothetical protein